MAEDNGLCGLMTVAADVEVSAVPMTGLSVRVCVVDTVAEVSIEQRYLNTTDRAVEVAYKLLLNEKMVVCSFGAQVDSRLIEGVVRETEDAQEAYDLAVESGHASFFLRETLPDVFKAKVGRLSTGSSAEIRLTYITQLKIESGQIRFVLPKIIMPHSSTSVDLQMDFEARFQMASPIAEILSPNHQIVATSEPPFKSCVRLAEHINFLEHDLELHVHLTDPHQAHLIHERSPGDGGSAVVMLSLAPWCSLKAVEQKTELVLAIDRSGSMEGAGIRLVRQALKLFLHSLPADCYVNVVGFGFSHQPLYAASRRYGADVLAETLTHTDDLEANMGGTEIYAPLEWILERPPIDGYLRQVFLLTDGEVCNEDQVIALVRKHSHRARVFALGLGNGVSRRLVEGVARAGNGTAAFVSLDQSLDAPLIGQLRDALQPTVTDVHLEWHGSDGAAQLRQIPSKCPLVLDGKHLVVYGLAEAGTPLPTGVTLTASSPVGPLSTHLTLDQSNAAVGRLLHRWATKKLIEELQDLDPTDEVMGRIIDLGCRYGLASHYTAFVAVDPRQPDVLADQSWMMVKSRDVPNTMAFGDALPAAAPSPTPMLSMPLEAVNGVPSEGYADVLNDHLIRLISGQSFEGIFDSVQTLAELLDVTVDELHQAGLNVDQNGDATTWSTHVALAFLSEALPSLEASWSLVAVKSHQWLRSAGGSGIDVLPEAQTFVRTRWARVHSPINH